MNQPPRFRALLPLIALLAAASLVACNRGTPSATPTPSATATTPSATATASASPTPPPTPTPIFPLVTGQPIPPIVAQVIAAVVGKQMPELAALVGYQQVACTTAQGAGGPPKCKPGDAAGTVYRVFATGTCEGEWTTDGVAAVTGIVPALGQVYAAARIAAPTPDPEPYWPKGQSVVMFSGRGGDAGGYLILSDTQIVRAHRLCGAATSTDGMDALLKSLGGNAFYIAPSR